MKAPVGPLGVIVGAYTQVQALQADWGTSKTRTSERVSAGPSRRFWIFIRLKLIKSFHCLFFK